MTKISQQLNNLRNGISNRISNFKNPIRLNTQKIESKPQNTISDSPKTPVSTSVASGDKVFDLNKTRLNAVNQGIQQAAKEIKLFQEAGGFHNFDNPHDFEKARGTLKVLGVYKSKLESDIPINKKDSKALKSLSRTIDKGIIDKFGQDNFDAADPKKLETNIRSAELEFFAREKSQNQEVSFNKNEGRNLINQVQNFFNKNI